jgi:hypothetical protein
MTTQTLVVRSSRAWASSARPPGGWPVTQAWWPWWRIQMATRSTSDARPGWSHPPCGGRSTPAMALAAGRDAPNALPRRPSARVLGPRRGRDQDREPGVFVPAPSPLGARGWLRRGTKTRRNAAVHRPLGPGAAGCAGARAANDSAATRQQERGLAIDDQTCRPRWDGGPLDSYPLDVIIGGHQELEAEAGSVG